MRSAWPVRSPTRIFKSFLAKFRAKRAREWSGRCRKYFACLQPDDSWMPQSILFAKSPRADRAVDGRYADTKRGLRSNKTRGGGLLSKRIHFSRYLQFQCPVAFWAETAFIAAKLSEQIATEQLFLSNKLRSLEQVNKA